MLDLFNIAKPQNCDIQTFYGTTATGGAGGEKSWTKPRGVSHVYMLLIGPGGTGDTAGSGGGSGAVTTWYGAAQHVPDSLVVSPGAAASTESIVSYRSRTGLITLLTARFGATGGGGSAMTANYFTASGFFQSVAGQASDGTANQPASSTTFLSAGNYSNGTITANYGYSSRARGFFMLQPMIVGTGGAAPAQAGGIGCGGNGDAAGKGGPGMILIASW